MSIAEVINEVDESEYRPHSWQGEEQDAHVKDYRDRERTFKECTGSVAYFTRERRCGILGFFGFRKTVRHTLIYSST